MVWIDLVIQASSEWMANNKHLGKFLQCSQCSLEHWRTEKVIPFNLLKIHIKFSILNVWSLHLVKYLVWHQLLNKFIYNQHHVKFLLDHPSLLCILNLLNNLILLLLILEMKRKAQVLLKMRKMNNKKKKKRKKAKASEIIRLNKDNREEESGKIEKRWNVRLYSVDVGNFTKICSITSKTTKSSRKEVMQVFSLIAVRS